MQSTEKNIVCPNVRKLRWERGLKQKDLAARLQIAGWSADRIAVSKIESRIRCVADYELLFLAKALGVNVCDFFANDCGRAETHARHGQNRQNENEL